MMKYMRKVEVTQIWTIAILDYTPITAGDHLKEYHTLLQYLNVKKLKIMGQQQEKSFTEQITKMFWSSQPK